MLSLTNDSITYIQHRCQTNWPVVSCLPAVPLILNMAVIFASLHIAGTIQVPIAVLKMMCKGGARALASSFNTLKCTRSGPGDFPGFIF